MTPIRVGVAGLGRAFSLMAPTLRADSRVRLVAAADPRTEARRQFESEFGGRGYAGIEELCADPAGEGGDGSTPPQFHAPHAAPPPAAGQHHPVLKPKAPPPHEC